MFDKIELNFEISFTGNPYRKGHYTLKVEGLPIEYLMEAPKRERPAFEIARSEVKAKMASANPWMKFPFNIKGKFMCLLLTHNKMTKFTKV